MFVFFHRQILMKLHYSLGTDIAWMEYIIKQALRLFISITLLILSLLTNLCKSRKQLILEIAFLRLQLSNYEDRKIKPKQATPNQRIMMAWLSKLFNWRDSLIIVKPETLLSWHKSAFKKYWELKCKQGRPEVDRKTQALIRKIQRENPLVGQQMISFILLLKFGIRVSPRSVAKYMIDITPSTPRKITTQNWETFIRNHTQQIIATDFMTVVSWNFQIYYVLVIIELRSRKIIHTNVTKHPTAEWSLQQFREAIPSDHQYKYLIHDRDSIFSNRVDQSIENLGVRVLKTPPRSPQANGSCERVIGTIRRDCMDHIIPLSQSHLKRILNEYIQHYNHTRPHSSLLNFPDPPDDMPVDLQSHRHKLDDNSKIATIPVLGGLHHDYRLSQNAA